METMFLVAGLAVAGLAGIAAAFYFSIRSGNRGEKRLRSAGAGRAAAGHGRAAAGRAAAGRAGAVRRPAGGSDGTARPDHGRRTGARTGEPAAARRLGDTLQSREDSRPGDAADDSWPDEAWPDDAEATNPGLSVADPGGLEGETRPGGRSAARLSREAPAREAQAAADTAKMARQRRRVGFRKGADVDEELWPTEGFGGVSDEQFWDDLASDKPLTTTARTAQQDTGTRGRPLDAGSAKDPQAAPPPGDARKRDSLSRNDRNLGESRRGGSSGAYPGPRSGPNPVPNPATERTAIQPAYAAAQPAPARTPPAPSMTPPTRTPPAPTRTPQYPAATQPVRVASSNSQPMSITSQSREAAAQPSETRPSETRRRRPSSAEEDPLTSAAFSLRSSGPVDGRSSLRSRDTSRDQYDAAGTSGPVAAGSYGSASPYPYPMPSYGDPSSATQTMATPPYGENYGYGSRAQADEPRRQNGTRSHARPEGAGEGTRTARQAYPQDAYQGNGGYPADGSPATGGYPAGAYPGNGQQAGSYPGNGHRAPYDPRDDYRRLAPQR